LIVEESKGPGDTATITKGRQVPWLRLLLSLLLSAGGLWFIVRDISLAEMVLAMRSAHLHLIGAGFLVIAVTTVAKSFRWWLLFQPRSQAPSFSALFWSLSLGQLVNTAVPFLRLGEVARLVDFGEQTGGSKAQALGTLVVEKVLDMIMLALTLFLLLPFLVIPTFVSDSGVALATMALVAFAGLYIVAFKGQFALKIATIVTRPLPDQLREKVLGIMEAGLHGLTALQNPGVTLALLLTSAFIAFLSVLTPWVLFRALDISLGLVAASAIHVVLTIGTLPPSTPAKVGVFEFLVAFMLAFFGVENAALVLTYTIIYHLVVVLPQIVFGGIAAARGARNGEP